MSDENKNGLGKETKILLGLIFVLLCAIVGWGIGKTIGEQRQQEQQRQQIQQQMPWMR